jgi:mRNA interferase MazF
VKRGDIVLVNQDPVPGKTAKTVRLCAVLSPNDMNDHLATVIVAPLSTQSQAAPFHVEISHAGKKGWVLLEQCRAIEKARCIERVGALSPKALGAALAILQETFSP